MSDLRITPGVPLPVATRPAPVARAEAVRAAQRAFFQQAVAAPPSPEAARLRFEAAETAPDRPLRPGSFLDIKV